MKIARFIILVLLLVSAIFLLLNGCSPDIVEKVVEVEVEVEVEKVVEVDVVDPSPQILTIGIGDERTLVSDGQITDIKWLDDLWILVSSRFEIRIYDNNKKLLALLTGHPGIVKAIALSPDNENSFIAAGCSDGTIRSWNVKNLKMDIEDKKPEDILRFTDRHKNYYQDVHKMQTGSVEALTFSSMSSKLFAGGDGSENVIVLCEINKEELAPLDSCEEYKEHTEPVTTLTVSHNDNSTFLASGGQDNGVNVWDYSTGRIHRQFPGHENDVTALVFLRRGNFLGKESRYLASGGKDSQIILWDLERKGLEQLDPVATLSSTDEITALAFMESEKILVGGTKGGEIYCWDMTIPEPEGSRSEPLKKHGSAFTALASSTEGTILVSGSADGIIQILTVEEIRGKLEQ